MAIDLFNLVEPKVNAVGRVGQFGDLFDTSKALPIVSNCFSLVKSDD